MTKPKKTERRKHSQSVDVARTGARASGSHSTGDNSVGTGITAVLAAHPNHEAQRIERTESQPCRRIPSADFAMAVRELANFKWEPAGFPAGDGFDFWLQAEQEIRAVRADSTATPE